MSTKLVKSNNTALLLASIREHLGRGKSLYENLLREGVPKESAKKILSLHTVEDENINKPYPLGPYEEIPSISKALLK